MNTQRTARLSFLAAGALTSSDIVSLSDANGPVGSIDTLTRTTDSVTITVMGQTTTLSPRTPVKLIKPRDIIADPNTPAHTPWAVTLLTLLETINNAGGVTEDENGNLDVVDELEQGWPDLADVAHNAYALLLEHNNPYATLIVNRD